MKINYAVVGVFVLSAVLLFSVGLFLIGNRHKAFSHHVDFSTKLNDVNGISPGSKVRVSGFEAGQVTRIEIPDQPSEKFRLKLHADDNLHNLIRDDSFVTVESDGLVGDKFLLIHEGRDLHNLVYRADYQIVPAVTANSGLRSPIESETQ
jgi:phospholipid/cholesterol/gamma-HCH transport system substrate-binding protein